MSVFQIQNFKFGLDARRGELTSQVGTLEMLQDAHINQGAEIEKRKAFVEQGAFSANVFGLEVVASGLVAFGSKNPANLAIAITYIIRVNTSLAYVYLDPSVTITFGAGDSFTLSGISGTFNGTYTITGPTSGGFYFNPGGGPPGEQYYNTGTFTLLSGVTLPANVSYIQCLHPSDISKNMTAILCSCDFGGQAFCAAAFGSEVYLYLNGVVIPGSIAGQVLTSAGVTQSIAQIAAQMFNLLNSAEYQNAGVFVENLTPTGFNIYTAYGVTWSPVTSINHVAGSTGVITTALLSTSTEPINGNSGDGQLTLYAGNTGSITALKDTTGAGTTVNGATIAAGTYNLITSTVAYSSSLAQTITNLATAVGTQAPAQFGITASTSINEIDISTTASLPSNYLSYGVTGNLCFENMSLDFSGITGTATLKNIYVSNGVNNITNQKYGTSGNLYGNPTGNVSGHAAFVLPYGTYLWIPGVNDTSVGVAGVNYPKSVYPNGVVLTFTSATPGYLSLTGKPSASVTASLFLLTDILNNAGLPLSHPPTGTQIANIASAITTGSSGFVASNSTVASASGLILYISRRSLAVNAGAYNNLYFYIDPTVVQGVSPSGFAAITPPASYGFGTSVASVTGRGTTYSVNFSGTWQAGDQYIFDIVTSAVTYTAGIGRLTGIVPSACITLSDRVHLVAGSQWLGSDNGDATGWEQQAAGAFAIDVSQNFGQSDQLISLAAYQGRIALFANYAILIFSLDANPQNIALVQPLKNIGTFAALGPQSLGDLDVVFPSITGFRSLRVRDLSLNAYVNDLGSPVDLLVQNDIIAEGLANLGATCGIVDPSANRFWFFLNGQIYVLSYFPSAKIFAAWGIYTPTYYVAGVQTTFVPIKFLIYNSQVYFIASVAGTVHLFLYGGTNNNTYDVTSAIAATPWLDFGAPGNRKQFTGIDFAMQGAWQVAYSSDYYGFTNNSGQLKNLTSAARSNPSFQLGNYALSTDGFHLKLQATCASNSYSTLSALDVHYQKEAEK